MPASLKHSYTRYTIAAIRYLGQLVRLQRIERRMTAQELSDRLGVSRGTIQRLERGDPKVALGIAFEACAILGIPLFEEDRRLLSRRIDEASAKLALLPKSARVRALDTDDDF